MSTVSEDNEPQETLDAILSNNGIMEEIGLLTGEDPKLFYVGSGRQSRILSVEATGTQPAIMHVSWPDTKDDVRREVENLRYLSQVCEKPYVPRVFDKTMEVQLGNDTVSIFFTQSMTEHIPVYHDGAGLSAIFVENGEKTVRKYDPVLQSPPIFENTIALLSYIYSKTFDGQKGNCIKDFEIQQGDVMVRMQKQKDVPHVVLVAARRIEKSTPSDFIDLLWQPMSVDDWYAGTVIERTLGYYNRDSLILRGVQKGARQALGEAGALRATSWVTDYFGRDF